MNIANTQLDMRKIADSGQIFRFNILGENEFELLAGDRYLKIKEVCKKNINGIECSEYYLECTKEEFEEYWEEYFDLKVDYDTFSINIPKEDIFLNKALEYSRGIRILKQDKWEMLISFIISQRKSIPAIKSSIEKLCEKYGKKLKNGKYAFPTPSELANADIDDLNSCSLGYRSSYIKEVAVSVASGKIDLEKISDLDDENLLKELMSLKGVGIKVASCVALFGYYRIAAFPIDVWIQKMIDRHYNGNFPFARYEGYAGVIQQYIFFYGRENEKIKKS